jgi:hypothetical protein
MTAAKDDEGSIMKKTLSKQHSDFCLDLTFTVLSLIDVIECQISIKVGIANLSSK